MQRPVRIGIMELRRSFTVREMLRGFSDVASEHGWAFEYLLDLDEPDKQLAQMNPDVCLVGAEAWQDLPHGLWSTWKAVGHNIRPHGTHFPSVVSDDTAVGLAAARYLLSKHFAAFGTFGFSGPVWCDLRLDTFRAEISAAGKTLLDGGMIDSGHVSAADVQGWLRSLPAGTAILAGCDFWAEILLLQCRYLNLSVPEQIAVLGVDDDDLICELCSPSLSSVRIPWRKIGLEAAHLVEDVLAKKQGADSQILVSPGGVVERRSTEYTAVAHPEVSKALRHIHEHLAEQITVDDLADRLPANRRWLERAFRKYVGRSVNEEIRRIRVERVKQLLIATQSTMPEIARRCGFGDARQLSKTFRQETGTTPTGYRADFSMRR